MNLHDSEHIAGVLQSAGYRPVDAPEHAGVVVFNTCSVRASAEDRVWGNLGALASRDKRGIVAVCGCMAERLGSQILERSRVVDLVFSVGVLASLPELIDECAHSRMCETGNVQDASIDCLPTVRRGDRAAWVPVSHGCDNQCAYCVVPAVRGPERSRPSEEIVAEVEDLVGEGVLEVVLLGQNVNSYGRDLSGNATFASLLRDVCRVQGITRVKFETSHPRDLGEDILEVMGGEPSACEYLHMPVQSGSDRILAAMNRGYTRDGYLDLIETARRMVPGLTLTTDIIVGFPGETVEDYLMTRDLVLQASFDAAYVFLYSQREGTPAASMEGEVTEPEKHRRFEELVGLQDEITGNSLSMLVGTEQEVLVEGPARRGDLLSARTRGHRVVLIGAQDIRCPLPRVLITAAGRHALRGTAIDRSCARGQAG
jgi:tRNA-2-methylthio-N6-dimethylallyladenosine synthase